MRRHHRGSLGGRREPAPSRTPRALLIALTLVATACREAPAPEPQRVAVPATVVALAPSLVELLYELGLGDRLVGVGDYVKYPPEATEKLRLGGLFDPHLEEITRLAPDIAILLPSEERTRVHLDALGIEVLTVANESLEDIEATALTIARRFSIEERGEEWVAAWREALRPRPLRGSPRVMLAVSRQRDTLADTMSAGPGTFYDELLRRMGAVNVFADAVTLYPQINLEEVVRRDPEAILDLRSEVPDPDIAEDLRDDWVALGPVRALETGCHAIISGSHVLLPGPRLPRLYEEIRSALMECGF